MTMRAAVCLLKLLVWWVGIACNAQAALQDLTQARAVVTVGGVTSTSDVTLPYHWDRFHGGQAGEATFEVPFTYPVPAQGPHAVYFLRLGNAYEVWLNGTLLQSRGNLQSWDTDDYAKAPRIVAIPPQLLREENMFRIRIRADGGRRGGVAPLLVGTDAEVSAIYGREYLVRVVGSQVVMGLALLVGVLGLVLWATQSDPRRPRGSRRDNVYLYAGLAELAFALRVGDALVEQPPLPWVLWGTLVTGALAAWLCSMVLFFVNVADWPRWQRSPLLKRTLWLLFISGVCAPFLSLWLRIPLFITLWQGIMSAFFVPFGLLYLLSASRGATRTHVLVAVALLLNIGVGLRDWIVLRLGNTYGDNTLLRYSAVLFGLTLGYIVLMRFRTATRQAGDLMATLEARVAQRETELAQSYQQFEALAREQERAAERARVLRDMHDGVGSHITSAMRQLQSGKGRHEEVLRTLGDSLDQLKLSIDAIHLPHGDVTALLANLRYRLEPRFAAGDIELEWQVDALAPITRLDGTAMQQLRFMLFEAFSNVLQHANASVLRIEAAASGPGARLRIIDNGRGFDCAAPLRKGLLSMRERAGAIGAVLTLTSEPGRTVVEIFLD